jgi:predicted nicotinamide N-methyase
MTAAVASLHSADRNALRHSLAFLYDVVEVEVHVNGAPFQLLKVRDTNKLVDAISPKDFSDDERLPYWAEVWPSSIVLAHSCLTQFDLNIKRVLELGCGLGLAGIAAAPSPIMNTIRSNSPASTHWKTSITINSFIPSFTFSIGARFPTSNHSTRSSRQTACTSDAISFPSLMF